jgi:hypothetical protein
MDVFCAGDNSEPPGLCLRQRTTDGCANKTNFMLIAANLEISNTGGTDSGVQNQNAASWQV